MKVPSTNKLHWLDIAERGAVIGSVGGSVASILLKQFLWATIPLSVFTAFAVINHQRLRNSIALNQQGIATSVRETTTRITELKVESARQVREHRASISELDDELEQVRNSATTELARLQRQEQEDFDSTSSKLQDLQNSLADLTSLNQELSQNLQTVDRKQQETGRLVRELRAIDIFTQNIQAELNTVQSYFERGLAYQRLGNKHRAIDDYSKTIELDSNHPQAYHSRGLLYAEMSLDRKAVIDLRRASQLYFDQGNLDKYRETKDLVQKVHQDNNLDTDSVDRDSEQVVVGNLFG